MAKKKQEPKPTWTNGFVAMAAEINKARRRYEQEKKVHKIPAATIFMDGKKVVLNG